MLRYCAALAAQSDKVICHREVSGESVREDYDQSGALVAHQTRRRSRDRRLQPPNTTNNDCVVGLELYRRVLQSPALPAMSTIGRNSPLWIINAGGNNGTITGSAFNDIINASGGGSTATGGPAINIAGAAAAMTPSPAVAIWRSRTSAMARTLSRPLIGGSNCSEQLGRCRRLISGSLQLRMMRLRQSSEHASRQRDGLFIVVSWFVPLIPAKAQLVP